MNLQTIDNGDAGLKARNALNASVLASRLAVGGRQATIATFGDSISGTGFTGLGAIFRAAAQYWAPGLNIQLAQSYSRGGSLSAELIADQGANTAQLTRFQNDIAGGAALPDICAIQTHSNDNFNGSNAASFAQNQIDFANAVLNMGVPLVIMCSALPKTVGSAPSGRAALNAIIRRFCDVTPGCVFFDWHATAVHPVPTSTTLTEWNPAFGSYTSDGVHPSAAAQFFAGRTMAALLSNIVGRVEPRTMGVQRYGNNSTDTWFSWTGGEGNFPGTNGQLNGVDNTGVAGSAASEANRWNIITPAGITVTPSIIIDAEGRRHQRLELSGTPSVTADIILRNRLGFLDTASAIYDIQAVLNVTNLAGIRKMGAQTTQGPPAASTGFWEPPSTGVLPTHSGTWFLRNLNTPAPVGSGGSKNNDVVFGVTSGVPVSGTVDVSRFYIFRVE